LTSHLFNPFVAWLVRRGVNIAGAAILEVVGRRSGEPRRTPVNPLTLGGERFLLAPRGETEWVRNIRVTGRAALLRGKRREEISIAEVTDAEKLPIIRAYLKAWAWEVGAFFEGLSVTSSDDDVRAVASGFPVFQITAAVDEDRAAA
jgi:deazaflavin-dependent oxidoreductase (nitroreductase family)